MMSVVSAERSDLDLFALDVMADPYPHLTELRERAPVIWMEKLNAWAVTRYAPIRETFASPEKFSSTQVAFNDAMNEALVGTALATDPPDHAALRSALTENLSPRALRGMKARIDQQADDMVAELVQRGSFDAIDDLARALPLMVVVDLIGVTGEARDKMLNWGETAFDCLGPMNERAGASFPTAGEFFRWTKTVTAEELREGSMGRGIFLAAERGVIAPESCGDIIHSYVAAGMDTTIAAIGNAVKNFAAHPDQFDLIRAESSLVPSAFNEILRYEAPILTFGRRVIEDTEIEGTPLRAGEQVALLFGAGNRDPRHYDAPDSFLVQRNPADHLSFGYGIHSCAGQGLARLEVHAAISALARRAKRIVVGSGTPRVTNMTLALDKLPVLEIEPA